MPFCFPLFLQDSSDQHYRRLRFLHSLYSSLARLCLFIPVFFSFTLALKTKSQLKRTVQRRRFSFTDFQRQRLSFKRRGTHGLQWFRCEQILVPDKLRYVVAECLGLMCSCLRCPSASLLTTASGIARSDQHFSNESVDVVPSPAK